jgi:hypothetical protein
VELHPDAGILLLVKIRGPAQGFDRNVVFPDQHVFGFKVFAANAAQ